MNSEQKVCVFVIERENRGVWEPIYNMVNYGYIFTNTDPKPRRVINKTDDTVAILPPGKHYGKDLKWEKL